MKMLTHLPGLNSKAGSVIVIAITTTAIAATVSKYYDYCC